MGLWLAISSSIFASPQFLPRSYADDRTVTAGEPNNVHQSTASTWSSEAIIHANEPTENPDVFRQAKNALKGQHRLQKPQRWARAETDRSIRDEQNQPNRSLLGAAPLAKAFDFKYGRDGHLQTGEKSRVVDAEPGKLPGGSGTLVVPKFEVVKSFAGTGHCKRNDICYFHIDVKNSGNELYQGSISVTDKIFNKVPNLKLASYSANTPWKCKTLSVGRVRCDHASVTLKPGESLKRLKLGYYLPPQLPKILSQVKNCAQVKGTGMGTPTPWSCATAPILTLPQADLKIQKEATGGKCNQTNCTFRIRITNIEDTPYKGPIYIYDAVQNKPAKIDFYGPKSGWSCARTGFIPTGNLIFCSHKPVTLYKNDSVSLTIRLQFPITAVQVKNCTGIRWPLKDPTDAKAVRNSVTVALRLLGYYKGDKDGAIPATGPNPNLAKPINDYLAQEWNLAGNGKITPQLLELLFPDSAGEATDAYPANDGPLCIASPSPSEVKITGKTNWEKAFTRWLMGYPGPFGPYGAYYETIHIIAKEGLGAPGCYWPFCSFFEFTAANPTITPYVGPLSMRIIPPVGSDFRKFRVTKSTDECPAKGWSCDRSGHEFMCRHPSCSLSPGEETTLRIDGTLLPGTTSPPRVEMNKTACGVVEWSVPAYKVFDIGLPDSTSTAIACHTTRVFAGRRKGQEETTLLDLGIQKTGPKQCPPDGVCLFKLVVANRGTQAYEGPLTILDDRVEGWRLVGGYPAALWECADSGSAARCQGDITLAPGEAAELFLEFIVQTQTENLPRDVENCARLDWTEVAESRSRRDNNPENDRACWTTRIEVPR